MQLLMILAWDAIISIRSITLLGEINNIPGVVS